jgi:hypothetical protein
LQPIEQLLCQLLIAVILERSIKTLNKTTAVAEVAQV